MTDTTTIIPRSRDRRNVLILYLVSALLGTVVIGLVWSGDSTGEAADMLVTALYAIHTILCAVAGYGILRCRLWGWIGGLLWSGLAIASQFWVLTFSGGTLQGAVLAALTGGLVLSVVAFGYTYELRLFYLKRWTGLASGSARAALVVGVIGWVLLSIYAAGTIFGTTWHRLVNLTISGVGLGSLYALGTIGFVLIYKITGVLNFSQGMLVVLGAYSVVLFLQVGLPISLALGAVVLFAVGLGLFLERAIFQHFVGESKLSIIIVTLALIYMIEGFLQMIIGGRRFRGYPSELSLETVTLPLEFSIRGSFLLGVVLSTLILVALLLFFKYTVLGSILQASASDQVAAMVLGVSITQTIKVAWVMSIGLTMVSGVLMGISQGGANFGLENVLIFVFAAAIFGGLDSLSGAFVGSLVVGVLEIFGSFYYAPVFGSGFGLVLPMLFLVAVIIIKPYGLWGTERIERL